LLLTIEGFFASGERRAAAGRDSGIDGLPHTAPALPLDLGLSRTAQGVLLAEPVIVVGAGPAGLAVAAELGRRDVEAAVVDKASSVAASWRGHYDRLHLHTVRWLSGLPGLPIPRDYGPWVSRDHVVAYLEEYTRHHSLTVRLGVAAERVLPGAGGAGWSVITADGPVTAPAVVVATGYNHTPRLPEWPGREAFSGELRHAARYRNGAPYQGRDVLVVGAGNTGAEIAVDLVEHGAARVRLAVRTPPHIVLRSVAGLPATLISVATRRVPSALADPGVALLERLTVGDLSRYGLRRPGQGLYRRVREQGQIPIIDVGLVDAVKAGNVEIVPAVTAFDGSHVVLADGNRVEPEAVIVATGYDAGLTGLVGHLGVLDSRGHPIVHGSRTAPGAPGLYFTGYTNPISGMFRELRIDARRIARTIARRQAVTGRSRADDATRRDRPSQRPQR
jgi:putative flavoprotein involved in K+ transport